MSKPKTLDDLAAKHDPVTIIAGLRAELAEARSRADSAAILREWIGTAKLELSELQLPKWVVSPKTAGAPGVPTLQLSDFHWGERVDKRQMGGMNEFNLTIAHKRLKSTVDSCVRLARIVSPEMEYPGIVAQLLGDMISGNIHDELQATNELNTMPTVLDLYRHLVPTLTTLADVFGRVFVPCVGGNHGRDTKKTWAKDRNHTSFDWLLYQFLAEHFAATGDSRVVFYIPDGADGVYRAYNTRYLITHGDQFRAGDSIIGPVGPLMRGEQKKSAAYSAVNEPYDIMCFGHWHTRYLWARGRGNGTLKGYDEYAKQNNFRPEPPSQNFWITHPDHGITFDAPLYCDRSVRRAKAPWASVTSR